MPYEIYVHSHKTSYQSDEMDGYVRAVSRDRETADAVAKAFNDTYDHHITPHGHYSVPEARVYGCSMRFFEEFRIKFPEGYTVEFSELPMELLDRLSAQDSRYF